MAKTIVGIDMGSREVKAVAAHAGRGGRATITQAERFRLPGDGDLTTRLSASAGWLRQFLAAEPGAAVVASIPSSESVAKIVDLPPASGATLEELVKFEVEHSIPFTKDQGVSDFVTLRASADATTVLIAWAKRQIVQQITDWIRLAGGKPRQITLNAPARMTLPMLQSGPASPDGEVVALLDVDTLDADILLIDNSTLRLSRAIKLQTETAAHDVPAPGGVLRSAAVETRRMVQAYRAAHRGSTLRQVMLCGSGGTGDAARLLESELGTPVRRVDPWAGLVVSGPAARIPPDERGAFACATGLALGHMGRGLQLDLIPEESRSGIAPGTRRSLMRLSAFLIAALSIVAWLAYSPYSGLSSTSVLHRQHDELDAQLRGGIKPTAPSTQRRSGSAAPLRALTEEIRRDSVLWLEVLRLLSERLPKGVTLTELSMEKGQSVVIRGHADNNALVADALIAVQAMPMFDDARIAFSNTTLVGEKQRSEFEIVAALEPLPSSAAGRRR